MFSVYSSRDTGSYNPLHRCMRSILLQIKQHFHLFFITTTKNKVKCLRPTGKFFPLKNFQVQNQHLPWRRENPKTTKATEPPNYPSQQPPMPANYSCGKNFNTVAYEIKKRQLNACDKVDWCSQWSEGQAGFSLIGKVFHIILGIKRITNKSFIGLDRFWITCVAFFKISKLNLFMSGQDIITNRCKTLGLVTYTWNFSLNWNYEITWVMTTRLLRRLTLKLY